jgi:DNA-binding response OmpR family regulator
MSETESFATASPGDDFVYLAAFQQLVLERTHDLITVLDPSGTIVFASPSWRSMTGWDPDALVGTPILELVRGYLARDGYRVVWVRSGEEALVELDRHRVRIVILDIGLPGKDGFDVCRDMRARSDVPILMLTARDEEPDRIVGLEVGADDYLTKPFSPRELLARMKAILRRSEPQEGREKTVALGDVVLDRESHDVTVAGKPVELTAKEFDLLAYFMANPGVVVSRDLLLERVWGQEYPGGTRTVDVHVAQVRRKLDRPDLIRTLRGTGYKAVES